MLTADLVRVRRRGGRIEVRALRDAERERMLRVADAYVALANEYVGSTRGELEEAWDEVPNKATDYKLIKGLRKLLRDRCQFEPPSAVDPVALRREVFVRAAAARAALSDDERLATDAILAVTARDYGLEPDAAQAALFADLREHHRFIAFEAISGEALVHSYELAQQQAVLLRAVRVELELVCRDAESYRQFFRKLKFRRLLYRMERASAGYRIVVDGPLSLFQSVTKYGLQLALMLPVLQEAGTWRLAADVRWGKSNEIVRFELEGMAATGAASAALVPDDVAQLQRAFDELSGPWRASLADEILELPGVGLCVPDLVFHHESSGQRVFLEVMGYWSRRAVWQRVELVQAGLAQPIVFAVSRRLRVSEEVLDADLPGQLYVYKGVMSARSILERLEALVSPAPNENA